MKVNILFLISIICMLSCDCEDIDLEAVELDCLIEYEEPIFNKFCYSYFAEDCFNVSAGYKFLSENSKNKFIDFCFPLNSEVTFSNDALQTTVCTVIKKDYYNSVSRRYTPLDATNCKSYCLESQNAYIVLKSDKIFIRIELETALSESADTEEELKEKVQTRFSITSCVETSSNGTKHNTFFYFPYEDYKDEIILPDTSKIKFYETILLNGVDYSNIYSSEIPHVINTPVKEHIYFNPDNGLVAVRDAQGVLWTKD